MTIVESPRLHRVALERTPLPQQLTQPPVYANAGVSEHRSRRALLRGSAGLVLALTVPRGSDSAAAQAAPVIRVAAPQITDADDCLVTVSVSVVLMNVPMQHRYSLYGDILEWDADTEDAQFCCTLDAQHILISPSGTPQLTLRQQVTAVNLGLVRGLGPSEDERYSPNLVELVARIWLRDLETDVVRGPWDSPQRVAVSRSARSWASPSHALGNPLMTPRPNSTSATDEGGETLLAPPSCVS